LGKAVAIYRLLQNSAFGPDDIKRMASAYERGLVLMHLKRDDPLTETLAQHIVEIAQTGEKDPEVICGLALKRFGKAA
jgi:hypothetical protein